MTRNLLPLLLMIAAPVGAVESDETLWPETYRARCVMPQACILESGCSRMPQLGELLLVRSDDGFSIGRDDDDLSPIDHYADLEAMYPLPEIDAIRRDILVSLPRDVLARRFALFTQIRDLDTDAPILRNRYVTLDCYDEAP